MQQELLQVKQQLKWMRVMTLCSTFLCASVVLFSFGKNTDNDIIRAKGIVIVDSAGRDRILIGAPIPESRYRVRTDTALVRKHWAKHYPKPDQYMQWYRDYLHSTNGMVLLNEQGFDKLLVGDQLADPNTGKRITIPTGITWNDDEGYERGGMGLGKVISSGKYRNIVGLDDANTGEALHLAVLEDGTRALRIADEKGALLLGMAGKDNFLFQNKEAFTGAKYFNHEGKLVWEQKMDGVKK